MKKVAVIGAGAAGCFCAARLARLDPSCRITLFEAHKKPLAKVAVTGGGRCNLTNTFEGVEDLSRVYPRGASLMKRALRRFGWKDTWAWMQEQGVALVAQEDHCVFPRSQDAMQIVRTLLYALHRPGVEIRTNCAVSAIEPLPEGFSVRWEGGSDSFDAVVVTTGGSPRRSGHSFLDPLALAVEEPVPSLYTFTLPDDPVRSLTGQVVEPVAVSLSGTRFSASGALLITDWGMSGPAILKLSSYAARYLAERSWQAELSVNWAPAEDARACVDALLDAAPQKQVSSVHPAFLPARLWRHLTGKAGIPAERRCAEVGSKGRNRLADLLVRDTYRIGGRGRFKEEFVTCGGVSLKEIDPNTLESRRYPGLYFAGEVLDVDAITGGFNLQAAWTTGWLAAGAIAGRNAE
ncbi:MAG: NAD(P)/FAD-dependent oxidoreductase [Bacteroidales bacterium]|nr:NAD(P)/FAD-dependent oxidoreductase [Bacteroidales bacterium]